MFTVEVYVCVLKCPNVFEIIALESSTASPAPLGPLSSAGLFWRQDESKMRPEKRMIAER
jgi:hypothetical protein